MDKATLSVVPDDSTENPFASNTMQSYLEEEST